MNCHYGEEFDLVRQLPGMCTGSLFSQVRVIRPSERRAREGHDNAYALLTLCNTTAPQSKVKSLSNQLPCTMQS